MFCEKPPKGFEKYFKPGGAKELKEPAKDAKEVKEANGKDTKAPPPKEPPKPTRPSTSAQEGSKPYEQWSFGLFGGTGRG